MANETELEKIDRAAEYFERYFEFEDAVTVSKENKVWKNSSCIRSLPAMVCISSTIR